MALTATFVANFDSFYSAVTRAQVQLRSFEDDAGKVSKAVNRIADSFSGRKIVQEAHIMAAAMVHAGGMTKLTDAELRRLAGTVGEASEKMRKMGMEVPPGFKKITDAAHALDVELKKNELTFRQVATAAAAVAGIIAGVSLAVGKLGERGADVNNVSQSFKVLTTSIGESSDAMLGKLRKATQGNISDTDLMKVANLGLSQGLKLTATQFGLVGDVAAVLSERTGGDLKTAFETLTQAMATGQDRTLKTIGLNIDAARATQVYAESIGKKVSELDEDQRKQAISNAILAEGQRILQQSGKAQEDFGDKVAQSRTKLSNFVDSVGSWIATTPSIGAWTTTVTAASSSITAMGLAFGPASRGLTKLIGDGAGLGNAMTSLTSAIGGLTPALGRLGTSAATSSIAVAGLQAGLIGLGVGITLAFVFSQLDKLKKDLHAAADAYDRLPKPIDETNKKLAEQAKQINANNVTLHQLRGGMEATIEPSGALGQALLVTAKSGGAFSAALTKAKDDIAAMAPALRRDLVDALKSGAFSMDDLQRKSKLSETAFRLFAQQVNSAGKETNDIADALGKARAAMVPLTEAQKVQVNQWNLWGVSAETAGKALDISGAAIAKYLEKLHRLLALVPEVNLGMADFSKMVTNSAMLSGLHAMEQRVESAADALERFKKSFKGGEMLPDWVGNLAEFERWKQGMVSIKETTLGFGSDLLKSVPDAIMAAVTGGGSKLQAAGSAIGMQIFGKDSSLSKSISRGISGLFGKDGLMGKIGGELVKAIPVIGSLIGPALSGLTSLFGKMFGTAGRDAVREFAAGMGGFDAVHQKLGELGAAGEELWIKLTQGVGRNNPAQAKAAIEAVNKALGAEAEKLRVLQGQLEKARDGHRQLADRMATIVAISPDLEAALQGAYDADNPLAFLDALRQINSVLDTQEQAHQDLTDAANKYNIEVDKMGKAWQTQELNKKAQDLFKDYQLLNAGGVDHTAIVKGMSGAVSKYIQDAKKMGIEVPSSMRPMLQAFIDAGKLTDEEGRKIKNLESIGVAFGDTLEQSMGKVAGALERLVEIIEKQLAPAIKNIPDGDFTVHGKVAFPDEGFTKDMPEEIIEMAKGGRGVVRKPTLFRAGEAGPEAFAFGKAASGAGVVNNITVNVEGSIAAEQDLKDTLQELLDRDYQLKHKVKAA